jgi:DNA-binding winged helix-turn-helix (wHTH) protein
MTNELKDFYEFEDFRLDPDRRLLMRGDNVMPLTPKQFSLLFVLVQRKGELVSYQELKKLVWPETRVVENKSLTQTIYSVRSQLGDSANQQRFIENVPRKGYRFASEIREWRNGKQIIDIESPIEAKRKPPLALVGFRWWITLALLGLAIIVGVTLLLRSVEKSIDEIEISWPKAGAEVSGVEPFKAAVRGLPLDEYQMFWKLGDDRMNLMFDSNEGYPHKEFLVEFSDWKWRGRGPYKVNFVAMGKNNKIIAQESLEFFVKQE